MARTFSVVAILTVLSKVVGLVRDIVVAKEYGTSIIADAFNSAYLFTGNILILFGGLGGPFHSSTVAIVTPKKDDRESGVLVVQILAITTVVLTVVMLIGYLIGPWLAHFTAANYTPDLHVKVLGAASLEQKRSLYEQQFLQQLNIMLPLVVIAGIVGVSYGVLNVYHKIFWPSLSPAIASVAIIAIIWMTPSQNRLTWGVPLAVGTLAGAVGQMLAQFPDMLKLPLNWQFKRAAEPGLKQYLEMLWPATISTSVGQLTVYVDWYFSFMIATQGAWTAIVNSNRLVQLPLGILLTAMLVPILPRFTELATAQKPEELKAEMRRALSFLWFLSLPMTAVLFVIARPVIEVLFQRGHFNAESTQLVTTALVYLAPSIVFYVARDLMTRVFYAYHDSATPYKVAMAAILVKAPLDWMLVSMMKSVAGISLASTIMTIFNLTLLTWGLKRKIGDLGMIRMMKPLSAMLLAATACGALTWAVYYKAAAMVNMDNTLLRLAAVFVSSGLGGLIYLGICVAFKLNEPVMLARRVPILRNYMRSDKADLPPQA